MKFNFKAVAALILSLAMTGCANDHYTKEGGEITTSVIQEQPPEETITETAEVTTFTVTEATEQVPLMITDREGNDIFIPDEVNTVISMSPVVTELLEGLGVSDRIIAADTGSAVIENISPDICTIPRTEVTAEELAAMGADVVIAGGLSTSPENAQLAALKDMGIKVLFIPYSNSFTSIKLDIEFLSVYMGKADRGNELIAKIDDMLSTPHASSLTLPTRTVYFETSPAPSMQAAGSETLFGEILTHINAGNVFASHNGYISTDSAAVIAANPDVIISNVHTAGYDAGEISSRSGWNAVKAVADGRVYRTPVIIRPTHRIVEYVNEIDKLVYPEKFAQEQPVSE